jgi:plasmid stabilization system protein ParE
MPELWFSAAARADLKSLFVEAAWEYPAIRGKLESGVRSRCDHLRLFPEFGRLRKEFHSSLPGLRSTVVAHLIIYYRVSVEPSQVEVLRVLDGRRDQTRELLGLDTESEAAP